MVHADALLRDTSALDLSADLVGERLHLGRRAVDRRVRLDLVERALEREKFLVCERCPAVDEAEPDHDLTVAR
jgi:hypothetical protein